MGWDRRPIWTFKFKIINNRHWVNLILIYQTAGGIFGLPVVTFLNELDLPWLYYK